MDECTRLLPRQASAQTSGGTKGDLHDAEHRRADQPTAAVRTTTTTTMSTTARLGVRYTSPQDEEDPELTTREEGISRAVRDAPRGGLRKELEEIKEVKYRKIRLDGVYNGGVWKDA